MNTYGNLRGDLGDNGMAIQDVPSDGEGLPPLPSTTFAELVDRFCRGQTELRARLALADEGHNTPRNDGVRDPGGHRGR